MSKAHTLDQHKNLAEAFLKFASDFPNHTLYSYAVVDSETNSLVWLERKYNEVQERSLKIAAHLRANGVKTGDRVAIISQSRPEWLEADLAILMLGAVSVSVYQTLPAADIGYILFDSACKVVFAENQEQVDKLQWLSSNMIKIAATEEREASEQQIKLNHVISFEHLSTANDKFKSFSDILTAVEALELNELAQVERNDLATLVYTSGTTGAPKGVIQTHGNHLSNCRQAWVSGMLTSGQSIMVFLPLAHSFAKLMGYLGLVCDCSLKFPQIADRASSKMDPQLVTSDIRAANANIIPIVPRLLEKMQSGIIAKTKSNGLQALFLRFTLYAARNVYAARANAKVTSLFSDICYQGTAAIREKLKRQLFGEQFHYAIAGGAKLNPDTCRFFDMLGIEILEGYGLTETCVATNVNLPGKKKVGSVGPVLDRDIELKIAEDGEIVFRGPNIAKGYYQRPTATAAAWDKDGWFHTGDLGAIDNDGYLSIVGRKKDILVSSYGKNIAPEPIEALIKNSSYISQAVLVGDGRPFCIALLSLEYSAIKNHFKQIGVNISDDFVADQQVRKLINGEIDLVNKHLANYEQIRNFVIAGQDFTIENGLLTPTFKVKKKLAIEQYKKQIDNCYKE